MEHRPTDPPLAADDSVQRLFVPREAYLDVEFGARIGDVLVEQRVAEALERSDHGYVLETGRIVLDGPYETLLTDDRVRRSYLGLTEA